MSVEITVRRLVEADVEAVVAFSLAAWAPVFAGLEAELGAEVYRLVFPDWRSAQADAVATICRAAENDVWVAVVDGRAVGFVAARYAEEGEARAGEIYMVAVDPAHQGRGIATALMQEALTRFKALGLDLAVIGTGGDPGHAPARALYERFDFTALRQVRYYREL